MRTDRAPSLTREASLRQGCPEVKTADPKTTLSKAPAAPRTFKLAIVEDDASIRSSLQGIFTLTQDLHVVAACADAESALREVPSLAPDLVLMDIDLPAMSGIECLLFLKAVLPTVRVMMFTAYGDDDNLFRSLRAGADGFLLKPVAPRKLLEAVREPIGHAAVGAQIDAERADGPGKVAVLRHRNLQLASLLVHLIDVKSAVGAAKRAQPIGGAQAIPRGRSRAAHALRQPQRAAAAVADLE